MIEVNTGNLRAAVEAESRLTIASALCFVDPEAAVDVEGRVVFAGVALCLAT